MTSMNISGAGIRAATAIATAISGKASKAGKRPRYIRTAAPAKIANTAIVVTSITAE